ncbi:MAG TPA: GGDEF domain-containing protein, partial [Gemmatimonas sp.]|nr:GGDEF domain-containing protein [Gemmatimonas sp.]
TAALARETAARRALERELLDTKAALERARQQALHDALTGLPNRTMFLERLEHGLRQARRHRWTLAVLFIDLDGFKQINDSHGHEIGDEVLVSVGKCLQGAVRGEDTMCRYGGDEFACLMLDVDTANDVAVFAAGLVKRIATACDQAEHVPNVSASIGVALYPEHGSTSDTLLRRADSAMYQAKGSASRVVFYEAECAD